MTFFGEYKPDADLGDAHLIQATPDAHSSSAHDDSHAGDDHSHGHGGVHESPWIMLAPLVILAVLRLAVDWWGGHNSWAEATTSSTSWPGYETSDHRR